MKISTHTENYIRNGFKFEEMVDILSDAGFDGIDISFFALADALFEGNGPDFFHDDKHENNLIYFKHLKEYAKAKGVVFNQVHAPEPSSFNEAEKTERRFAEIVKAMEYASILGAEYIVVHPVQHLPYKTNAELLKKMNYDFYKSLEPYCEKYNIKVAIENMWQYDYNREVIIPSTCAYAEEHAEYVDMLASPWFVACLDIGHVPIVGESIEEAIKTLGSERLKVLHMHDVDYKNDNHTLPGMEKLNWVDIVKWLAEIKYDGWFTLEADNFLTGFEKEFKPTASKFMAERTRFLADMFEENMGSC